MTNRVIKFRIWDAIASKYLENEVMWSVACLPQEMLPGQPPFVPFLMVALLSPVEKYTVQQFTGLTDKNGKEIYEGDIVKWFHGVEDVAEVKYVVSQVFNAPYPDMCYFGVRSARLGICHFQRDDDYTVIGNIFENPELLK